MIDLKSLRIGNKVHANVAYGGEIKTFKRFNDDLSVIFFLDSSIHGIGEFVKDCSGIPLSPSLLERAGFEEDEPHLILSYYGYTDKFDLCFNLYTDTISIFSSGNHTRVPLIKYFHQLQNLYYSLTGQELELKP